MPAKVAPEQIGPPPDVGDRYLHITVEKDGSTSVEAVGFNGQGCHEATKGIEVKLGRVVDRDEKPGPDAHQTIRKA